MTDLSPPDRCFDYLRARGEIIFRKDDEFDIIKLKIEAEGWFNSIVRIWSKM